MYVRTPYMEINFISDSGVSGNWLSLIPIQRTGDPIYQGILQCPKDPDNYHTRTTIAMCALLKLHEENALFIQRRSLQKQLVLQRSHSMGGLHFP